MSPGPTSPLATAERDARLGEILARSLEELVAAGRVETACSLAGLACAATRQGDTRQWKRFNALLHRWSAGVAEPSPPNHEPAEPTPATANRGKPVRRARETEP